MKQQVIDFLFAMNAAITNIRLYPSASEIIQKSVGRLQNALEEALAESSELDFAESGKNLLVCGEPLPEKQQQKPQIRTFLASMLDLGVRSITISQGVDRDEILAFIQIFGKTPEQINVEGGLQKLISDYNISNISIDEKFYVQMGSDQQIMSGLNISDEDFARQLVGEQDLTQEVLEQLREAAQNPELLARVFETGAKYILKESEDSGKTDIAGMFGVMLESLERINPDNLFGDEGFRQFLEEMDRDNRESLMETLRELIEKSENQDYDKSRAQSLRRIYDLMRQEQTENIHESSPEQEEKEESKSKSESEPSGRKEKIKQALSGIIKGNTEQLKDRKSAKDIAAAISQLVDKEKEETVSALINRLGDALADENPDVRRAAAGIMADIDARLETAGREEYRLAFSRKLVEWIKLENDVSEEYKTVTGRLESLVKDVISESRQPSDVQHILEAYNLISQGNLTKDEAVRALAANTLQNISTDHILDILLEESRAKDGGESYDNDDIYSLVILGTTTIERLLDRLRDSQSMSERNRIVQAVSQMGVSAIDPVVERLRQGGPWYYIRNLTLLLGRIGNQEHLDLLEPLLTYPDPRIQLEAVKGIQSINGEKAGEILLRNIEGVDAQLVSYIISVLGALRYEKAAPYLIELLESRRLWRSKKPVRDEIRSRACEALGRIQAREAISSLEKIVRGKGLFKGYPENVRSAAVKALASIKKG